MVTSNRGEAPFTKLPGLLIVCVRVVPDDVQYVRDVMSYIEGELGYRVSYRYATGFSNGGFMSHRLACEVRMGDCFWTIYWPRNR